MAELREKRDAIAEQNEELRFNLREKSAKHPLGTTQCVDSTSHKL